MSYPCHVCAGTMLPGVTYTIPREYDPKKPSCGKVYIYYQGTAYVGMETGGSLRDCGFCKGSGMVENRRLSIGPRRRKADRRASAAPEERRIREDEARECLKIARNEAGSWCSPTADDICIRIERRVNEHADKTIPLPKIERIDFDLDEYIAGLQWSAQATDHEKTLVVGNLRGMFAVIRERHNALAKMALGLADSVLQTIPSPLAFNQQGEKK